ncbi:spindle pole body interacting protein [Cryphonectria parasitica EP155]|uniref:Spindle pole body interacting protein n=1 Tax=Cryphonectria parasitica (strain ATCC 38755 / EP155) TaxID=660469 RepID=A0A9P4YA53_CRYP1|nr:spindle pole body interacting protein [Cryphonectria parasitica EP155]KAF3769824.1 spindle pole body interacting protein [Cryphonectria parasitica EP155]
MATAQTAQPYHTQRSGQANGSSSTLEHTRRTSLASIIPSSRSASQMSHHSSRPSRSPIPPVVFAEGMTSEPDRTSDPSSKSKTPSTGTGISSQHSSLSGSSMVHMPRYNSEKHSRRKLKSQYPRGSTENHVEYILVASFDIDRGPVMEHQYPVAITGDEHMLAELMLPDQAHMRNQDWTIFFLHKDTSQEEEDQEKRAKEERRRRRQRRRDRAAGIIPEGAGDDGEDSEGDDDDDDLDDDDESTDNEAEGGEGPPLVYVLNLVNTKQDKTVKRGAIVKAMAICTRHPFLHIYKPLLLLALEEYFKSPVPETLAMLYDAVNAMDLSLMPRLSYLERQLLQSSENKDLFVEKFEKMVQMRIEENKDTGGAGRAEQSVDSSRDALKRPQISRAGTKAHLEGTGQYSVPRDTHEFETKVMYKGIPIPIKVPVAVMPESVGDFSLIKLIQNFSDPHTKQPQPFPPHAHLTTNGPSTHPIIVLANALLTQKRVIFLGHNMPSGEVAEAVLGACALASGGVLKGFTRYAFPYTDLTKIDDLLKVPGFIAGVTNPTFEMHPEWWDVLCDLPSGRVKISSKVEPAPITEGQMYFQQQSPGQASLVNVPLSTSSSAPDLTGDQAFIGDVLKSIAARHGERVVRAKWRDWVAKFTRVAAAFEESVYGASALYIGGDDGVEETPGTGPTKFGTNGILSGHGYVWPDELSKQKELAGNVTRIEGWRNTRSYYSFIQDMAKLYTIRPLKGLDLHHLHDRLRMQRMTASQTREIYLSFSRFVNSYDEICLFLSVAPESHAGLFYLALGLFHKDREVRIKTAELLDRIGEHEAGQHWWRGMSRFEKLAYMRIKREADAEAKTKSNGEVLVPEERRAS